MQHFRVPGYEQRRNVRSSAHARLAVALAAVVTSCTRIDAPSDSGADAQAKRDAGASASGRGGSAGGPAEPRARVGDACAEDGLLSCAADAKRIPLLCDGGSWKLQEACETNERCETASGSDQGRCVPVAPECASRQAGEEFCDGSLILSCVDGKPMTVRPCGPQQRCALIYDAVSCTCMPGSVDEGSGCRRPSNCDVKNGGCDTNTSCTTQGSERVCGACPAGFMGTGTEGCVPLLSGLTLMNAALTPAFSPDVHSYRVQLPFLQQRLSLRVQAPNNVRIDVNGAALATDALWSSPPLADGEQVLRLTLTSSFGVSSSYELSVTRALVQEAHVKATPAGAADTFGYAVALQGDTLVVGSIYEDSGSNQIDGDQKDDSVKDTGAAYVYERQGSEWRQQAYLKSDAPQPNDFFGVNVSISGDTVAVGAARSGWFGSDSSTRSGEVHVFVRNGTRWQRQVKLTSGDQTAGDLFGFALALREDLLIVGAPYDGAGARQSGAIYVFTRAAGTWSTPTKIKASNVTADAGFGWSIALDGDTIVVGAHNDVQLGSNLAAAGSVYVFGLDGTTWRERQTLRAPNAVAADRFGYRVALRGNTLAVGAPRCDLIRSTPPGEVHVFERKGDMFSARALLRASVPRPGDCFGSAVALTDGNLLVGAMTDSSSGRGTGADPMSDGLPESGAVYIFDRTTEGDARAAFIKADDSAESAVFGEHLAVWEDRFVVGATGDSGQGPNSASKSGAVYVFR